MIGTISYLLAGMIYVKLEHDTFDINFEDTTKFESNLVIAQQIIHYTKILLVWPLYLAEDIVIFIANKHLEETNED